MRVELIYFEGCPHAERARRNVREALASAGLEVVVEEWERDRADAPPYVRRYASPTILIDGRDTSGPGDESAGASCRSDGAPSVEAILATIVAS